MAINIDGDGLIALGGTSTTQGRLRLAEDTDNGTNFVALQAPASIAADVTFTLPAADGTANQVLKTDGSGNLGFATPSAGKVLQVVSTTKTDTFSTSSTSFVDVTGLSLSITPTAATSKIFITYSINVGFDLFRGLAVRLMRDSTAICIGDAAGSRTRASNFTSRDIDMGGATFTPRAMLCLSNNFLDSPSTTSAITYKLQMGAINENDGTNIFVNRTSNDSDEALTSRVTSTITAMEIAG